MGLAAVRRLLAEGARVVVADLTEGSGAAAVRAPGAAGDRVHFALRRRRGGPRRSEVVTGEFSTVGSDLRRRTASVDYQ